MKGKMFFAFAMLMISMFSFTGCYGFENTEQVLSSLSETSEVSEEKSSNEQESVLETEDINQTKIENAPVLLYQGQASIRIVTGEGKVIYIDPYTGDGHYLPADLILVMHTHFDHSDIERVEHKNEDCAIITHKKAIKDGEHQVFDFGYVVVEAVEAGYNQWHNVGECVGYVLTFNNEKSVYVTGDTSTTEQMPLLAEKGIDYAFFCCDGVYNMGLKEAAECAEAVGAKHNIPYHMTTTATEKHFDRELAKQFNAPNRLIVEDGEEIRIE